MQDMPAKYIYEPWLAPLSVQRAANCVIGTDYPAPIVDHAVASKANMSRMKAAYGAAKEGGGDTGGASGQEGSPGGRAAKPQAKRPRK